ARSGWSYLNVHGELLLPDPRLTAALAMLRQKRRAVEVLRDADCPAEALRRAADVLAAIQALAEHDPSTDGTLRRLELPRTTAGDFSALRSTMTAELLPGTDVAADAEHVEHLESVLRLSRLVEANLEGLTRTHREQTRDRVARRSIGFGSILIAVALLWLGAVELARWPTVTASSTYNQMIAQVGPRNVVDHRPETEWLPVDGNPAWLELTYAHAREVQSVTLRNGHNLPYRDRASCRFHVELYLGHKRLARAEGKFDATSATPIPVAIHAEAVDRVRVVIDSFYQVGAALAEVVVQ
ncbi:MAG TPA: hypothetical protein VFX59_17790, partial [Polyangiales bacterium]|nr:hypothetical protein [Polyangiales bacterium]